MAEQVEARRSRGALAIALASCTWGTWSLFFRPAEARGGVTPALEAFVVLGTILVATAPLALRDRLPGPRPVRAWALLAAQGGFDAINALLFFAAMQKTSLAIAVLTHYLAPVLVAHLAGKGFERLAVPLACSPERGERMLLGNA